MTNRGPAPAALLRGPALDDPPADALAGHPLGRAMQATRAETFTQLDRGGRAHLEPCPGECLRNIEIAEIDSAGRVELRLVG